MGIREQIEKVIRAESGSYQLMVGKMRAIDLDRCEDALIDSILSIIEYDSGWVSVDDRYPDGSTKDGGISDWFNVYVKIEDDWQVAEACYISEGVFCNTWGDNIKVTHWMPLPQPPKSEEA